MIFTAGGSQGPPAVLFLPGGAGPLRTCPALVITTSPSISVDGTPPPEQVIGSSGKTKYEMRNGRPVLLRLPELNFVDDKEGKPLAINLHIGRRPVAAFGNSDGDRQMLEWTQAGGTARLMMLVHHDDAVREWEYGAQSKIGTFSDSLMAEAKTKGWTVVSMKDDWKSIFQR